MFLGEVATVNLTLERLGTASQARHGVSKKKR